MIIHFDNWHISASLEYPIIQNDNLSDTVYIDGELPEGYSSWSLLVRVGEDESVLPLAITDGRPGGALTGDILSYGDVFYELQLKAEDGERVKYSDKLWLFIPETIVNAAAASGGKIKLISYSQQNAAVSAFLEYLEDEPYEEDDLTYSHIADFAAGAVNADKPLGAEIGNAAGKLAIADNASGIAYVLTEINGAQTVYNITPNSDGGEYFAFDEDGRVKACGHLLPTGKLRMINCPNARNVRDLGGWDCDGGTVRYGRIIRGGLPAEADKSVLVDALGINAQFDLRGRIDAQNAQTSPLGESVKYHLYDSFAWYTLADSELWRKMLNDVFDAVISGERVYINCLAGADRTGTLALVIEGLLGMSRCDIDTDYELTSFYTGVSSEADARCRNEAEWSGLIAEVNAMNGENFRDKLCSWALSLGIEIGKINAFRSAMTDGTPEVLSAEDPDVSVTQVLGHAQSSNPSQTAAKFRPFTAELIPDAGYYLDSVQVTMGGEDITSQVFSGEKAVNGGLTVSANGKYLVSDKAFVTVNVEAEEEEEFDVTKTLGDSNGDNTRQTVIMGQSYGENITPLLGYAISGITVTMGGIDVSASAVTLKE